MDKVKIGFPIEYECDGIIYDGLFLREPEIEELEKRLKEINKITELEQQVKKQKEVIDKLKEFINKYAYKPDILHGQLNLNYEEFNDLLEILEDKEV